MQAISQTFFNCVLVLLITLAASVFTIHAQEIPDGPQSVQNAAIPVFQVVPISKSSTSSQRIRSHLDAHNLQLIDPASEAPQQTSGGGNSGYVFPSKHERLKRYIWETVGPWSLVSIGIVAGFDQDQKDPPEWGQGASGYGKRYASRLGQYAIEQTTTYGLSEAFRLDSSFERSKRQGFGPRLADALVQNVTSRTHNGKRIVSAPQLAGFYVGGLVPALTWYPSRFRYKDGLREGTYSLAAGFVVNVLREFIFH
jgi:hypothetical protein